MDTDDFVHTVSVSPALCAVGCWVPGCFARLLGARLLRGWQDDTADGARNGETDPPSIELPPSCAHCRVHCGCSVLLSPLATGCFCLSSALPPDTTADAVASCAKQGAAAEGRTPLELIREGQVVRGTVVAQLLYHGAQVGRLSLVKGSHVGRWCAAQSGHKLLCDRTASALHGCLVLVGAAPAAAPTSMPLRRLAAHKCSLLPNIPSDFAPAAG